MAKQSERFPSKWLRGGDLEGKAHTVEIVDVSTEWIKDPKGGKDQEKVILELDEFDDKKLICNVTNWRAIARLLGDDDDQWCGGKIEIYPVTVHVNGEEHEAIRVRAPAKNGKPSLKTRASAADDDDEADDDEAPPKKKKGWDPAKQAEREKSMRKHGYRKPGERGDVDDDAA